MNYGAREFSFFVAAGLSELFCFIFIWNHLFTRQKYKVLGGETACLESKRTQVQPQHQCKQHQQWWHTCDLSTGEQGQGIPGALSTGWAPFSPTSNSICVDQSAKSLFYSFDTSVALVNATLSSIQETAKARWQVFHLFSFQKNFYWQWILAGEGRIIVLGRCSH